MISSLQGIVFDSILLEMNKYLVLEYDEKSRAMLTYNKNPNIYFILANWNCTL